MEIQKMIDKHIDTEIEVDYYDGKVSMEVIRRFEKNLGYSLPKDFIDFSMLKQFPLTIMVKEEIWPTSEYGHVGPAWTSWKGFFCNSFSETITESCAIEVLFEDYAEVNAVPFLQLQANSSSFCFMQDKKIHLLDRSGYEDYNLDISFTEFFEKQLKELMNRKKQYKEWKDGKREFYEPLS